MAVWKDIKRMGTYMKRRIYRVECWEISAAGRRESEHADKCRKNCESNLQTGSTCRFLGQKWKLEVSGKAKPLRPVGWIRKVKGTVDMLGEVTP